MCGLVGMAGNIINSHQKMFKEMLIFDTVRGIDSTGVVAIPIMFGAPKIHKEVGGPTNLFKTSSDVFDDRGICKGFPRALLGHNRAATKGAVTRENAHPFTYDHITGMHNGTLYDWKDLEGGDKLEVDSEAMFATIAAKGIDHCWKSFRGDAAIVFWDAKDQTVNFVRNKGRPLWIATSPKKDVLFWASEPWMIRVAASRNACPLNLDTDEIFELAEDTLHSYKPTSTTCELQEVRDLEKKPVQTYTTVGKITAKKSGETSHFKACNTRHSRQINTTWAEGTKRLGKETRGIGFRVFCKDMADRFMGQTLVGAKPILVFPNDLQEIAMFQGFVDKKTVLQTKARMRVGTKGNKDSFCISGANVVVADLLKSTNTPEVATKIKPGFDLKVVSDTTKEILYPGFDGSKFTKEGWENMVRETTRSSCTWCDSVLSIENANDFKWLSRKECLCEDCSKEPNVLRELSGYFPNVNFN